IGHDQKDQSALDDARPESARATAFQKRVDAMANPAAVAVFDDLHAHAASAARRSSMAASASEAFEVSGPPACAMSGRPPPPLPPSFSAPSFTKSTALIFLVRSSVTPTTSDAL